MKHIADFETEINGIPCGVVITHYLKVLPDRGADSDVDFYGYTERDWFVVDRKGYKAQWLEKMINTKVERRINGEIDEVMA